ANAPGHGTGILHVQVVRVIDVLNGVGADHGAGRVLNVAVQNGYLLYERRIVDASEDEVALDALVSHAEAATEYRVLLPGQVIGETQARSIIAPSRVRSAQGKVVKQCLHRGVGILNDAALGAVRETRTRYYHAVVRFRGADDAPRPGIDSRR